MKVHVHVYIGVFNHKQRKINKNQLKIDHINLHTNLYHLLNTRTSKCRCMCQCVHYLPCGCNMFVGTGTERPAVTWCVIVHYQAWEDSGGW